MQKKANLENTRDNDMKTKKVCVHKVNIALGKNGGYMPSGLGSKLISVGRQAMNEWVSEIKIFMIQQL